MGDVWQSTGIWAELFPVVRDLGNSLDLDETLYTLDRGLRDLIGYDAIAVYRPEGEALATSYLAGPDSDLFTESLLSLAASVSGRVAAERRSLRNADPASDGLEPDGPLHSALSLPLVWNGELVSVLTLYKREAAAFTHRDSQVLEELAPKAAAAISNAVFYGRWEAQNTDEGTHPILSSQRALLKCLAAELSRCRRNETTLALVVCHAHAPTKALDAISRRFRESCREHDTVARLGGDIVLVLSRMKQDRLAGKLARLRALVETEIRGATMETGAAFYPDDGRGAEELLKTARERCPTAPVVR